MDSPSNNTCLITGGAGFIGSELSRLAAEHFERVVIVDNLVNGKRENVSEILSDRISLEVVDIRDISTVAQLLRDVDVVFHLACLGVRHSIHSPTENHEVNATATLRLLDVAKNSGIRRFVYVSTSEVYGSVDAVPPMSETHHTYPMTVYGASKLAGECYARAYHRTYGFETVILRPFNSFGPRCHHEGDSGEVVPKFMLRCLAGKPLIIFGDGSQTRDFTYVTDTARGIMLAALSEVAVGRTINLGSGAEITINDLAHQIIDLVGRSDIQVEYYEPRPGDVIRLCADTKRANDLLKFKPSVTLRQGLEHLRSWYVEHKQSPECLLRAEVVRNWAIKAPIRE